MHPRLAFLSTILALLLASGAPAGASAQVTCPPKPHCPAPADSAQAPTGVPLSLDEALARARGESHEVRLARARVAVTDAQIGQARAQALPQLSASLGYTRTFDSPFSSGVEFTVPDSLTFSPDASASLPDRVDYLERRTPTAALSGLAQSFGSLPFGQENAYVAALSASQLLYSGGRVGSALEIARHVGRQAELGLVEEVAEIELQVKRAYYQALLARELAAISEAGLAQAEDFLAEEQLRHTAGMASELDVLRAEVSRDNLRPQLVQARNAVELAMLDLKRLVDLPLDEPIRLSTPLEAPPLEEMTEVRLAPEALTLGRAAVRAAQEQVGVRAEQVDIARGSFLPSVSVSMSYGRQLFPRTSSTSAATGGRTGRPDSRSRSRSSTAASASPS